MSNNSRKGARAANNKTEFARTLSLAAKTQHDNGLDEDKRKELRYAKLEGYFEQLGEKSNRYLFYCPDVPFPCSLVKTIYQHANLLTQLGYTTLVMHEMKGFKPTWLHYDWAKNVKTTYLSEKNKKGFTKPSFDFQPTDSIVIPDGFWTVMEGFVAIKQVHKIVMAHGYGGFITTQPGVNWSYLGFTDVICVSEQIKEDYRKVWPALNYHVVPYMIDREEFSPLAVDEIFPAIGLSCRSREDAQSIINIFKNRYPFLNMFDFRILKKLDTEGYADVLKHCAIQVVVDEKAGHPPMILEAISCNTPTIAVYGRGYQHLVGQEGVIFLENSDPFEVSEALAHFCLTWLENPTATFPEESKTILDQYSSDAVKAALIVTYSKLQKEKVKLFSAIKAAVDSGKLNQEAFDESKVIDLHPAELVVELSKENVVETINEKE